MLHEKIMNLRYLPFVALMLGLSGLFGSSAAFAKDYLIEVVLFETVAGREASTGGMYYPKQQRSLRLNTEKAVAAGFLPVEQGLTLSENAASIAASGRYRLLRHLSWRQPGLDADNALAIRVALGETTTLYLPDDTSGFEDFIPAYQQPASGRGNDVTTSTVNGTIKVRLGRFLHMDTRLVYTDTSTRQSFRLSQSRKMRSGELHYIDNPRFGILTRITPLEDTAGVANPATSDNGQEPEAATVPTNE